jgi:hypothetical protein
MNMYMYMYVYMYMYMYMYMYICKYMYVYSIRDKTIYNQVYSINTCYNWVVSDGSYNLITPSSGFQEPAQVAPIPHQSPRASTNVRVAVGVRAVATVPPWSRLMQWRAWNRWNRAIQKLNRCFDLLREPQKIKHVPLFQHVPNRFPKVD